MLAARKLEVREALASHPHEGEILDGIAGDHLAQADGAASHLYGDRLFVADDVLVRDDQSIACDEEAAASGGCRRDRDDPVEEVVVFRFRPCLRRRSGRCCERGSSVVPTQCRIVAGAAVLDDGVAEFLDQVGDRRADDILRLRADGLGRQGHRQRGEDIKRRPCQYLRAFGFRRRAVVGSLLRLEYEHGELPIDIFHRRLELDQVLKIPVKLVPVGFDPADLRVDVQVVLAGLRRPDDARSPKYGAQLLLDRLGQRLAQRDIHAVPVRRRPEIHLPETLVENDGRAQRNFSALEIVAGGRLVERLVDVAAVGAAADQAYQPDQGDDALGPHVCGGSPIFFPCAVRTA